MTGLPRLRPLGYAELINEAFDLYKRNFVLLIGIGAVVYVAEGLLETLLVNFPTVKEGLSDASNVLPVIVTFPITKAISDRYLGRESSILGSWRDTLRRLIPLLLTSLLAIVLVLVGFALFLVPGIFASMWVFFLWNVMIAEERYYGSAIRRGRDLATGQWTRIFVVSFLALLIAGFVFVTTALIALALEELITALLRAVGGPGPNPFQADRKAVGAELFDQMIGAALGSLTTPIPSLLTTLLYFDVRVRKEGFDVAWLAQEIDGGLARPDGQ
jgi:hypothetical protein